MSELKIPQGYKKTEIGVIPEDWELAQLSNLCERISVGLATSVTKYYRNKGVPIVRNMNIKDGYFDSEDMLYLDSGFAKKNISKAARAFDVITVHTGSNIGLTCVLPENFDYCQTFTTLITTTNKKRLNPFYLSFHMGSESGKKEILRLQVGGGKGNLNTGELKQYLLSYPKKLTEQTAIATALSDVDALICELEKLIAKKQAIKTATMQQLLTGKTRLPQFALRDDGTRKGYKQSELGKVPEDWDLLTVTDVADFSGGSQPPRSTFISKPKFEYIRLVQIRDYKTSEYETYIPEKLAQKKCSAIDIMIGRYGPPIFQILRGIDGAYNVALIKAIPKKIIEREYLYYFLKSDNLFEVMDVLSQRSSGQTGVDLPALKAYPIPLPSIPEQTAIATILSDMDSEIQALKKRLNKTRQIKQGMMQELLTGKTRLVQPEARGV